MKCEEFQDFASRDPLDCSNAEVASFVKHSKECLD